MQKLFSSGTVILFTCAPSGDYPLLSVSDNVQDILGFKPSYFLTHDNGWSNRIHPEDKDRVFERFNQVVKEGVAAINEYRFQSKEGNYIWLRDELKLINKFNVSEAVIYGSAVDITDRKQAELALKESKQQYESVVEHIKDVTYTLDGDGRLLFLNQQWEERTGYPIEDSCGKIFKNFIYPEDRQTFQKLFDELVSGEIEDSTKILRCLQKDGGFYWAELYAKHLPEKETNERIISGTLVDVSKDIARQKEIKAINEQLEKRVSQRSEQLNQEIEKRKAAEQELQKRLGYEKAISKCSSILLKSSSDEALQEGLQVLLEATGTDRVYVYNNRLENDNLYLNPIMEVCAEGVDSPMANIEEGVSYSEVPWWHQQLYEQKTIHSLIDDIPEPERSILEGQDVKSVLAIPITMNEEWFGYIGFAETKAPRIWDDTEISLLKTVAEIIAAFEKRKMIEESLVQQRNYTETILNSLPSIFVLMNEELELLRWNKNAEKYTGYSSEELKKMRAFDFVAEDEYEELKMARDRVIEDIGSGVELDLLTKSNERIPYFWRGYFIELDHQKCFLSVGIDISQQKQTEKELLDEKRFNEALIESLPGIFYMIDADGNYHRWNKNFEENLGYSPTEIRQMTPAELFTEEDFGPVRSEIENVFKLGESEIETEISTKDGRKIPYFLTGKVFIQNDKEYLVGVGHDISEQKQARDRIKKSEELFRNLFLKAPAAIVMVNPDNKVTNVNESFEKLFGYAEPEIVGKDIDKVIVPEDEYEDAPKMPIQNYAMNSFHKEARRLTKDGELIDVFVAAIPVFVDGKPLSGFGMYIDITEQKKYEKEIYSSLKEKNVLLQEIHHRVKNNLAVVSGLIQLQMYETDDPEVREILMESESRIQTMALIHEKLYQSQNLSRISCEKYIGDLVETIRSTVRSEKDISVITEIEDIKLNINKAVPFALLVNEVVTNSFKHAFEDQEEGTIKIQLRKDGGKLKVDLRDDGKGLPDDFSADNMDSLGITLIRNFVKQLDAEWELGSDGGTYIKLVFEIDNVKGSSASSILDQ